MNDLMKLFTSQPIEFRSSWDRIFVSACDTQETLTGKRNPQTVMLVLKPAMNLSLLESIVISLLKEKS